MHQLLKFLAMIFLLSMSCQAHYESEGSTVMQEKQIKDTLIGKKIITNEIPGSVYRKRATSYFVIVDKDTSDFRPVFIEYNNGSVGIKLNISYFHNNITHKQRMNELDSEHSILYNTKLESHY